MTKKEFVELYAKNGGFTKKEAERVGGKRLKRRE